MNTESGLDDEAIPTDLPATIAAYVAATRAEGERLTAAATTADLAAPVPGCPGWDVRQIVVHQGAVHRWAAWHLRDRSRTRMPAEQRRALEHDVPADRDGLLAWYGEGHAALLAELAAADPADDGTWRFLPARSGAEFWSRRQAHETGIHRADVESAGAGGITPYRPAVAADGIDELLLLLAGSKRGRHHREDGTSPAGAPPWPLLLAATDVDRTWRLTVGEPEVSAATGDATAGETATGETACEVRATASDLYLWAWNRLAPDALEVTGDPAVLARWAAVARVG